MIPISQGIILVFFFILLVKGEVDLLNLSINSGIKFEAIRKAWRSGVYPKEKEPEILFDEDLRAYLDDYRENPGIKISFNELTNLLNKDWPLEPDYQTKNLDLEDVFVCDGEPCKWEAK